MDPRRPVIPIGIEEDEDHVELSRDGTWRAASKVILSEEDVGRMHAGYVCARCWEVQVNAFPEECSVCRFPMSDKQSEFLAKAYKGSIRVGPSTSLEDELAALDEWEARQKREEWGASVPSIVVPGSW